MKIDTKDLAAALSKLESANAVTTEISIESVAGLTRLVLTYEDQYGDATKVMLAEANSGGFNYITTTKRL